AIRVVLAIAKENSTFPVLLQWTGGRAGGHHSLEDFHQPILETYGAIRSQPNVVLVAGSGFGDAEGTLPYITGDWSKRFGRAPMPFDGILVGSRVLVAKEAGTSLAAKELIAATPGLDDSEWERSYAGACGGVAMFVSEYGEKNHVLANRAALFARELQESVFSQPRDKQLPLLLGRKAEIIERINRDHMRPWFGKKSDGCVVDIEEMTYAEVAHRLVETMYVKHQSRWIHPSYRNLVFDFLQRIEYRLNNDAALYFVHTSAQLDAAPFDFVSTVVSTYPACQAQLIGSEDVQYFISLCQRRGQKPVPFVPRMDEGFSVWLMKDTTWQSEDLDAVVNQDVQRVYIQQGPVAAQYSTKVNEPVKDILDGIYHGQIAALLERYYGGDRSKVPAVEYLGAEPVVSTLPPSVIVANSTSERVYYLPTDETLLPDHSTWISAICGPRKSWLHALLTAPLIFQGPKAVSNYVRKIMRPRTDQIVTVYGDDRGSVQSLEVTRSSGCKDLDLAISDKGVVMLNIYQPSGTTIHALGLHFVYHPSQPSSPIHEVMSGRDNRIRQFNTLLWAGSGKRLPQAPTFCMPGDTIEIKDVLVTNKWVSEYCSVIGTRSVNYPPNSKKATLAPMDMLAIVSVDNLLKSMTSEYVHNGLFNLVHLFNRIQYVDGAKLLKIGDTVSCKSTISELANTDVGKRAIIDIKIYREGAQIAVVRTSILWRGVFIEEDIAYKLVTEPVLQVTLKGIENIKVLETREWFVYCEGSEGALQPGSVLEFHLKSDYRYSSKDIYSNIKTAGTVLLRSSTHKAAHIADVSFECSKAFRNPVTEYLARHGQPAETTTMFEGGGCEIVPKSSGDYMVAVAPDTNWPYSRASGDCNPIHINCYVADMAGLPGTVTHGLWTSASTRCFIERHAANDQPERVRSYHVNFQGMVFPKDHLETKVFHVGMKDGRMLVKGQTFKTSGELVLDSIAEIEQETTAYVFTGQGSQEIRMGMDLYESSPAARAVWDRAEQHMLKVYGVSLLKIVRTNPTQLTVFFGGRLGAQIRSSYMALSKHCDNKVAPLFPDIAETTGSFTFRSPSGLLNATQFTQPALVVLELAAVADLCSRSLVQKSAAFAGHSLGEYSALAAIGEVFSVEDAVDIAFYRGMVMQSAIDHDEQNRSQFGMVAVDPSRVGSGFDENALALVVETIRTQAQGLLEIVNYNVKGSQYVALASTGGAPLKRGRATVPLAGIDVPFHSTQLAPGVEPFREYLLSKIDPSSADYSTLHNHYIPNLTGLPFEVSQDYFKLVHNLTESPAIGKHLQKWD
ncbi:fatty acid synthase beta subunit, partial [Martensiomyces pterosporus]